MTTVGSYAGARALVLGGSGFIGRWLVRALASRGALVFLTARDPGAARASLEHESTVGTVIPADLSVAGTVRSVLDCTDPDVVFNLAVHGVDQTERDPAVMKALNTSMPKELCERLATVGGDRWSGLRLVQAGTALEYGNVSGPLHEDMTPNPTTAYGQSKLEATRHIERVARSTGLKAVVVRLFTVYGWGEHAGRLLPSLVAAANNGTGVPLTSGVQRRDFTYVEDVVEGLLRLAMAPVSPGLVVNLATGTLIPVRTFAETAAPIVGLPAEALEFGALPDRTEEMCHDDVAIDRLKTLTGWHPSTGIAEGVRRTWEWSRVDV